jgi:uncharacterized protein (DUF362 family)
MAVTRRDFVRIGLGASAAGLVGPSAARAQTHTVGVGHDTDPYAAAWRAITASGEWPSAAIPGRTVIVKPNLVTRKIATSGETTDPEVVRAVVDLALRDGASEVLIVESAPDGANFTPCGYDGFATYDPAGRVRLVDLNTLPVVLAPVPAGLAYKAITVPELLIRPDVIYVSVAKLKVHVESTVTLSVKNQFGAPVLTSYLPSDGTVGRYAMHHRGLQQTIVDLNLLRPVHFALIDGVWGLDEFGPVLGTPVRMDLVLAGRNAVAVDRVAMSAIGIPQGSVQHLLYASRVGLGPPDTSTIATAGDALPVRQFSLRIASPYVEFPRVFPSTIGGSYPSTAGIVTWYAETVYRTIEVARFSETSTAVETVRTLLPYALRAPGFETTTWDGRTDAGEPAGPGRYGVHVRAYTTRARIRHSDAVGWITVAAS